MNSTDERLARLGFDPDQTTYEFFGCFTLKQAQKSLFGSTRYQHFKVYLSDEDEGMNVPVVIDRAQPCFIDSLADGEMPDWYFEGWIFDPGKPDTERVRIYVHTMNYNKEISKDDIFQWQIIPDRPKLPPDASLRKLKVHGAVVNRLKMMNVTTIRDLIEYARRHDLTELKGVGPVMIDRLTQEMEAAGYPLP